MPVCLARLFPHDSVEAGTVLVAEDKADIVVVGVGIDEESAGEINTTEGIVTWVNNGTSIK